MTGTAVNNAPILRQIMGKRREGMEKTKIEKGKRRVTKGDVTEKVAKIKQTKVSIILIFKIDGHTATFSCHCTVIIYMTMENSALPKNMKRCIYC